jgi:uncharacterized protein with HEPN domain
MSSKDLIRLKHMLDATEAILSFLQKRRRTSLDKDRMLTSAVLREFEILGEAAGKVSEETKILFPECPWRQLVGLRNRLIHAYFDISHDIVWKTAKEHLPILHRQIQQMISACQKNNEKK